MTPWMKLLLALLFVLPALSSVPSSRKEVEGVDARSYRNSGPAPETSDLEVDESQQVSLITTIKYLPVEAKKARDKEHKSYSTKGEEFEKAGSTKARRSFDDSKGNEKGVKKTSSANHKEGHHKGGGRKYRGGEHKRSYAGTSNEGAKGSKGHAIGSKGHRKKGRNTQGFKNVWKEEEHGRAKKFYDDASDLKYHSDHDHLHIYDRAENTKGYSGGATEKAHQHREHGQKYRNKAGGSHDSLHGEDESYSHGENHGHKTNYLKKGGYKEAHGSSAGNKNAGKHDLENSSKHKNRIGHGKHGVKHSPHDVYENHGSHSKRRPSRIVVRRRKLGPVKNFVKEEDLIQEASSDDHLVKEPTKNIEKSTEKERNPKAKPSIGVPSGSDNKISEGVSAVQEKKRLKRIPNKNIFLREHMYKKTLPKRKAKIPLRGDPLSLFVLKEDLDKIKASKILGEQYDGHFTPRKTSQRNHNILHEENNEVSNDTPIRKDIANTVQKPVVVPHPIQVQYSSKEDTSVEASLVRKPQLIPVPTLKKQKTQQFSVVSDIAMEPSSTEKGSKPTSYKKSKAHETSNYQDGGQKVAKGSSQSSGYKGSHHGDYGKTHDSKFFDKEAKKGSGHSHQNHYGGRYNAGKKASKGHAHGKKGHHHKGHNDKGFTNVHHKTEYSSKTNFYHDDEAKKYHDIFDDFDAFFANKMKDHLKDHNFHSADYHDNHGHSGYDFDKLFEEHVKSYTDFYGDFGHYDDHHNQNNKKQHKNAHHYHHNYHWK